MNPQDGPSERLGWTGRVFLATLACTLLAVLIVARRLEPDPKGYGTHTQLGLMPCAFRAMTGHPCPSCGMTTSFAWFARGELALSWGANTSGSILAPACLVLIPWLLAASARGRPWPFRSVETPLVTMAVAAVALTLLSWTARMTLGGR